MTFKINKKQKLAICSWLFILYGIIGSLFSQTASFDSFRTLSGANNIRI